MIQVIYGKKGSGKTKRLIDLANEALKEQQGEIFFVNNDNSYMFDLRHEVRSINAGDYHINSADSFIGFICGLLAANFDVSVIYVDAFLKLVRSEPTELEWMFTRLKELSENHHVSFVISCNGDAGDAPEYMKEYLI